MTISARKAGQPQYDRDNPRPLPETMPLRDDLTGVDMAFPTASGFLHEGGAYLSYYEGQAQLVPRDWTKRASTLFFNGGPLSGIGLRVKDGIDPAKVKANIQWLLGSWAPKHEEKQATVGFALQCWCDPIAKATGE